MVKTSIQYMIILVVLTNIVAVSALLAVISNLTIPYDNNNNNNKDRNLFSLAHAQSSSPKKTTVILNLDNKGENTISKGMIDYDITNISSNDTRLQGATLAEGGFPFVSISGSDLNIHFTVHIPDTTNPNITAVKNALLFFNVDSIETKPDGNKIYYGKSGFLSNKIGDNLEFSEGILIENGPSQAQLLMYTK
jgi:hypothetical protein